MALADTKFINGFDTNMLEKIVAQVDADPRQAEVGFRVQTRWTGQTRSESIVKGYELSGAHIPRRFKIAADEPVGLLGGDSAPNPQELLMSALNA